MPSLNEQQAEGVDKGGLSYTRCAGDAETKRFARDGQNALDQGFRFPTMVISGRFHHGDRARECAAITGNKSLGATLGGISRVAIYLSGQSAPDRMTRSAAFS